MRLNVGEGATFQENVIPAGAKLAGWAALAQALKVAAPVRRPTCVADGHIRGNRREEATWIVFDKRYWPGDGFAEHLTFALRHENIDLLVLKRVFEAIPEAEVAAAIEKAPNGIPTRRAWYLYETLMGRTLKIDDAPNATAIDLLDEKAYFTGKPRLSRRHRVRDNLLGTGRFSPVIRRTATLKRLADLKLAEKARDTVGQTGGHLIARAASFLLLADSRASFAIEGERPPRSRLERWARAVLQAGKYPLTLDEIVRLHGVLIEDTRFVRVGLRQSSVFLGERDQNGDPLPEFIGARVADLNGLMSGLLAANDRMRDDSIDPVLQAAATAFGFVYVHPLEDGNGRLHRCLIHHVLAERKFTPPGMVFPVSSVMLDRIDAYRTTLQAHSRPLMNYIEWRTTPDRNVEVLNDTADLYQYYDCTNAAEFLYACIERTVEHDLPHEIDYLGRHDEALRRIADTVEMPDRLAEDLVMFIRQNKGVLPKKRRSNEFRKLKDAEVASLEEIVRETFDGFEDATHMAAAADRLP
jgi:Fic/DOC family